MLILAWRYFPGPNPHCHRAMLELEIELADLAERTTQDFPGFTQTLLHDVPGLCEHYCSLGHPGGFAQRLQEGTRLGHVVEHLALEFLHACGEQGSYGKTRQIGTTTRYRIAFEAPEAETGHAAAELARRYVDDVLSPTGFALAAELEALRELHGRNCPGPSTRALIDAAVGRGIPVRRLGATSVLELGQGRWLRRVQATLTDQSSAVAVDLAADKQQCKEILAAQGIPVPRGSVARTPEEAAQAAAELGAPVVVKPLAGSQGRGVTMGVRTAEELQQAWASAQAVTPEVLVEEQLEGRHYRMLVVAGRLVAAAERLPAQVAGDGRASVRELVDELNRDPRRGRGHEKPLTRVQLDGIALGLLKRQGLAPEDVPAIGRTVLLREAANLSTGGSAVDVTDEVAPRHRLVAERAARAIGLDVAGVDVVARDIRDEACVASVLEVNAAPGIRMHHFPTLGEPRDAAGAVIDSLFPPGSPSRVPLAAVTGSNGKTTTVRLIRAMLARSGLVVGFTCTEGHAVGDEWLGRGDDAGPRSAVAVLGDRRVEAAVLEVARGGISRGGLGYDRADVGSVLNITGDHLGQDGIETIEQLTLLKALVVEAVQPHGRVVLNAEDAPTPRLMSRAGAPVVLFAVDPGCALLRRHVSAGGEAVVAAAGQLAVVRAGRAEAVLPVRDIRIAGGGLCRPMLENALAAAACALSLGVAPDVVASVLQEFGADAQDNPGRLDVRDVGGVKVVVDYGHNAAALEALAPTLRAMCAGSRIGVVGLPGDRRDEDALALGRAAAETFDVVLCKEDQDRRGRQPGEVAQRIAQGVRLAGGRARIVLSEREALHEALREARAGDLVAVFYEHLGEVLDEIEAARQASCPTPAALARQGGGG